MPKGKNSLKLNSIGAKSDKIVYFKDSTHKNWFHIKSEWQENLQIFTLLWVEKLCDSKIPTSLWKNEKFTATQIIFRQINL